LAADQEIMTKTGKILNPSDLAKEYGFVDLDGRIPDYSVWVEKSHWLDQALEKLMSFSKFVYKLASVYHWITDI